MSQVSGAARGKTAAESVDDKHRALDHMRRVLMAETRPANDAGK